jgi:predicted nucleotidyltransferase
MLDKAAVINMIQLYVNAVTKEFSPAAIVLFGSYAKGTEDEDSDIDIGVVFNGFDGDWLNTSTRLWSLAYGISYDIEPHLLDITRDDSGFVRHVFKTGLVLYQA